MNQSLNRYYKNGYIYVIINFRILWSVRFVLLYSFNLARMQNNCIFKYIQTKKKSCFKS